MKPPYLVAVILYCIAIFWASHQPELGEGLELFPGMDKLAHLLVYAGLAALVSVGLRRSGRPVHPTVQFLGPIAFAAFYGLTDELHQYFVPGRSFDPLDLVANTFGAIAVQWVLCRVVWGVPIGRQVTS